MKILRVNNNLIEEAEIDNTLEALQAEVDGYIENVTLVPDKAVMIVNEEGHYLGMGINLMATAIAGMMIVGPAIIVGVEGENYTDISDEIAEKVKGGGNSDS